MRPKTILTCLTTPDHAETLLKVAVPLARKHNAHLIGLHTIKALIVYPGMSMYATPETYIAFDEGQKAYSQAISDIFSHYTRNEDFVSEFRHVRAEPLPATEHMIESARAADLVIMSQEDKNTDRVDQRHAQEQVIRESGRPVIVVPLGYDGPEIGQNILLGWSETREATRAAHDMLNIADDHAAVTVLGIHNAAKDVLRDAIALDLTAFYSRHGLTATLEHRAALGEGIPEVLNTVAFEKGADLIVTGAFGHSKTYDFVIGATTFGLLETLKIPVLFSK